MAASSVSVDGRIVPAGVSHLSAWDRGFQLGDGVFETLRAPSGRPFELGAHVERLRTSLDALAIAVPTDRVQRLANDIDRLLAAEGLAGPGSDAVVRITISRGVVRARGILPPATIQPTIVIQAWPMEPPDAGLLAAGLRLVVSSIRRDPEHPLAGIKSTSRAEAVTARLEAHREGADDALFLTIDGYLSEATSANLFLVRRGELVTPDLGCAILPGITRAWLLGWAARVGLRPVEDLLTTRDLAEAEEAFLASSVAGVLPVCRLEDTPIGGGRPGRWAARARADREACFAALPEGNGGGSGAA